MYIYIYNNSKLKLVCVDPTLYLSIYEYIEIKQCLVHNILYQDMYICIFQTLDLYVYSINKLEKLPDNVQTIVDVYLIK